MIGSPYLQMQCLLAQSYPMNIGNLFFYIVKLFFHCFIHLSFSCTCFSNRCSYLNYFFYNFRYLFFLYTNQSVHYYHITQSLGLFSHEFSGKMITMLIFIKSLSPIIELQSISHRRDDNISPATCMYLLFEAN